MNTAYSYIRFSSPQQRKGDSARRQEEVRDRYIKEHGLTLDTKLRLTDDGVSGFRGKHRSDKHALGQFLRLVEGGSIKPASYLLVENLDRLSREDVEEGLHVLLGLILKGVAVVQLSPVVTEFRKGDRELSPKLMMAIMELRRGNSESEMKSVRIAAAWERKRQKAREGKKAVSAKCPGWLRRVGDRYEPIPERVAAVKLMFELSADGFGINGIIRRLIDGGHKPFGRAAHWSNSFIGSVLAGRAAVGDYQPMKAKKPEGEPITDFYPLVVTEEVYWRVQAGLKQRRRHAGGRSRHSVNLFAGLMYNTKGERMEYRWFTDHKKGKKYGTARYVNTLALMSQATLMAFPVAALEEGVLSCLAEVDPMEILPEHDWAEDEAMGLKAQVEEIDIQLRRIEDRVVAGETLEALVNAGRRLAAKKAELEPRLAAASERARTPQSEAWGACHTLIGAMDVEDREAARLRLQTVLRRVVSRINCLFVKNGRRHIACVQLHFVGSEAIRTVFVRYRSRLVNVKEPTPEHVSWSTLRDELPGKVDITFSDVSPVLRQMCTEVHWHRAFEPDRPTSRERVRVRKQAYMKTYRKR